jgi:hypothetical protein
MCHLYQALLHLLKLASEYFSQGFAFLADWLTIPAFG